MAPMSVGADFTASKQMPLQVPNVSKSDCDTCDALMNEIQ